MLILLIITGFYFALKNSRVQTILTQEVAEYLSEKLNAIVSVKKVDIDFFKTLVIEDVYIEDLHHDTLLYSQVIKGDIGLFNIGNNQLSFNEISLENTVFNLKTYAGERDINLQFIIDAFASGDTTAAAQWGIDIKKFTLVNASFRYRDENIKKVDYGIDFDDIDLKKINISINNIDFIGDTIFGDIKQIAFEEKSGFHLLEFSTLASFSPVELSCHDLHIKTPASDIFTKLSFQYDSLNDFSDFITMVRMKSEFQTSQVNFSDIAYFATDLKGIDKNVSLSGNIKGTVDKLKGRDMNLAFGENSLFKGDVDINGLPTIDETYIHLSIKKLITNKKDIDNIPLPPFNKGDMVKTPDNFRLLGQIRFAGTFTGFFNDFVAYGDFTTNLGKLSSDISLNFDSLSNKASYKGYLATYHFDAGKFFDVKELGNISLKANVKGSGFTKNELDATLRGEVKSVYYNRYNYKNINIEGHVSDRLFKGFVDVKDENLDMNFDGEINFTKKLPEFQFVSEIKSARLAKLSLVKRDSSSTLSSKIVFNLKGDNIDNILGSVDINNTLYSEKNIKYKIDNIKLTATENEQIKTLKLFSDVADAEINGKFHLEYLTSSMVDMFKNIISENTNTTQQEKIPDNKIQDFRYDISLKNTEPVTKLFFNKISIDPGTHFYGSYNSSTSFFDLKGNSPKIELYGSVLHHYFINIKTEDNLLHLNTGSEKLLLSDSIWLNNFIVDTKTQKDTLKFAVKWNDYQPIKNLANINGFISFQNLSQFKVKVLPSEIYIADSLWTTGLNNEINVDSSIVTINNLEFRSNTQSINVKGIISKQKQDQLFLTFSNFNLENFNPVTTKNGITLKGIVDGEAVVADIYTNLLFSSSLHLKQFNINNENLGDGDIVSTWDSKKQSIELNGKLYRGTIPTIGFSGFYYPSRDKDNLDLVLKLEKLQLQIFDKYVKEYVSDLKGLATGSVTLKGEPDTPLLNGKITLQKTGFLVNYLNTHYTFTNDIIIENNWFGFDNISVFDSKGNKAIATGTVFHNNFKDFNLDIGINAQNFLCLNTTENLNPLYYGKAFVSGNVNIAGRTDNLSIDINARTEKGTQFNIPLMGVEEISMNSFITFINKDSTAIKVEDEYKVDLSGIQLSFELDVTPDAEVQLIFDPKIGDVMKGKGTGHLTMEINTLGNFNIYGDYMIEEGEYLFTLKNVINKKFKIERGGTVKWTGDPYSADLNINAIYQLRTTL